ncbi:putative signal transducing protein [Amorphus sp. MBR-141]
MDELLKTNDMTVIAFVESLLKEAEIPYQVFDQNMSVIEGSIGILPRRVLVASDRLAEARSIVRDAGAGDDLPPDASAR